MNNKHWPQNRGHGRRLKEQNLELLSKKQSPRFSLQNLIIDFLFIFLCFFLFGLSEVCFSWYLIPWLVISSIIFLKIFNFKQLDFTKLVGALVFIIFIGYLFTGAQNLILRVSNLDHWSFIEAKYIGYSRINDEWFVNQWGDEDVQQFIYPEYIIRKHDISTIDISAIISEDYDELRIEQFIFWQTAVCHGYDLSYIKASSEKFTELITVGPLTVIELIINSISQSLFIFLIALIARFNPKWPTISLFIKKHIQLGDVQPTSSNKNIDESQ